MSTTWDAGFHPPSDDPLDGLARPPGDPGGIRALAQEQSTLAGAFHSAGEEFAEDSRYTTREWSGDASDAFAAHTTSLVIAVTAAAESDGVAAEALHQYADALAAPQAAYDEAAAQARAEERAAADALNDVVLDPGSADAADPPLPPISPMRGIARAKPPTGGGGADASSEHPPAVAGLLGVDGDLGGESGAAAS